MLKAACGFIAKDDLLMALSATANILSASRFVLAALWLFVFRLDHQAPAILGAIALAGAASDVLDGRLARLAHSSSVSGHWLDNVADLAFVLTALSSEAWARVLPIYIPALIAASFAQYAIDSVLIRGSATPVRSRLGHWGGIVNYGLVIVLALAPWPQTPAVLVREISPLLALFYVAAIVERASFYRSALWTTGLARSSR